MSSRFLGQQSIGGCGSLVLSWWQHRVHRGVLSSSPVNCLLLPVPWCLQLVAGCVREMPGRWFNCLWHSVLLGLTNVRGKGMSEQKDRRTTDVDYLLFCYFVSILWPFLRPDLPCSTGWPGTPGLRAEIQDVPPPLLIDTFLYSSLPFLSFPVLKGENVFPE